MAASSQSVLRRTRVRAIQAAVAIAVIVALSWALGSLIQPQAAVIIFLVLLGLTVAIDRVGEISVPFALSFIAVLGLVAEFLIPDSIVSVFDPVVGLLAGFSGVPLGGMDAVTFAVLTFSAIAVIWFVEIRFTSAFTRETGRPIAANPDTVARAMARRFQRLVDDYVGIGVALLGIAIATIGIVLGGVGDASGIAGDFIAEAPVVFSNLLTAAIGFMALGGDVPFLNDVPFLSEIGPVGFLVIAIAVLLAAVAVRNR